MRRLFVILAILILFYLLLQASSGENRITNPFNNIRLGNDTQPRESNEKVRVVSEETAVIEVVKEVGSSVVTIGTNTTLPTPDNDPFSFFFDIPQKDDAPTERYIGSGFVVKSDGLIVTNKHVVSDPKLDYIIINDKGNKYEISQIYRDPLNDIAILKVANPPSGGFAEIELGDSSKLEVGQFAIAIGTALGQFRNTVTTGVVSGLGRGISAGSPFEGVVERLDNVIQTDAAINPGNSGGPLLNASGQVIGVNTAIAAQGQNIGFAIPINIVKDSLENFNKTGQFNRPFLGVSYLIVNRETAIRNNLIEGAYVQDVVKNSGADKAGVQAEDVITAIDNQKITEEQTLATIISQKKIGDRVTLQITRVNEKLELPVTLEAAPEQ